MTITLLNIPIGIWALLISFIALIIAILKDFILPLIFKPNLVLKINNSELFVRDASSGRERSRWARIKIANKDGFFTRKAENCYLKLIEIRNSDNELIQPFNQSPLKWTVYQNAKNDLSKGESHFIDLVYESTGHRVLYPATISVPIRLLEEAENKLGPGTYSLKVGVYGDNFNSFTKTFNVELGKNFGHLKYV